MFSRTVKGSLKIAFYYRFLAKESNKARSKKLLYFPASAMPAPTCRLGKVARIIGGMAGLSVSYHHAWGLNIPL